MNCSNGRFPNTLVSVKRVMRRVSTVTTGILYSIILPRCYLLRFYLIQVVLRTVERLRRFTYEWATRADISPLYISVTAVRDTVTCCPRLLLYTVLSLWTKS